MQKIGVTERADPTVNLQWLPWVQEGNPAVLITKMPRLLLPMLTGTENVIIHCTITGRGGTAVEPRIDPTDISLDSYDKLCLLFGRDRVILRIDPIFIMGNVESLMVVLTEINRRARGRVKISFGDAYPHVRERFRKANIRFKQEAFHIDYVDRLIIWEELGKPEVCGEPGFPCVPCIGKQECEILGVEPVKYLRDQRPACDCLGNKVELLAWPPKCTYDCLYCYWKD